MKVVQSVLSLLLVLSASMACAEKGYTVYALNAGFDPARYGRFAPDDHREIGLPAAFRDPNFRSPVAGVEKLQYPVPQEVFQSARYAEGHVNALNYRLPNLDPAATYELRLYCAEAYYSGANQRVTTLFINGVRQEPPLDSVAQGGGRNIASERVFKNVKPQADGVLALDFKCVVDHPQLAGLELVQVDGSPAPVTPVIHEIHGNAKGVALRVGSTTGEVAYEFRRRAVGTDAWTVCATGVRESLWRDATGSAACEYAVRAVDVKGAASAWSAPVRVRPGLDPIVVVKRASLHPTHVYTYHVEGLSKGGGLFVCDPVLGTTRRLVDASEGIILDAQVSYDGRQILFSWKRTMNEPFAIWRIDVDGQNLTRVIGGPCNNQNACWLPDGGIVFTSDRKPAFAYCWVSTSPVLYRADGDGQNVTRISANYLTDFTPSVMRDGRVLYSRWEYVDRPAIPIQSLWAIQPDGTGLSGVFGNRVLSPATFMFAHDVPERAGHYLCVMTAHNGPCSGAIGLIDVSKGGNAQEAIRNLTPDVFVAPVGSGLRGNRVHGPYTTPYPIDRNRYLVSCAGEIQLRTIDGGAKPEVVLPRSGDSLGWYSPMPLAPRAKPTAHRAPLLDPNAPPLAEIVVQDVRIGLEDFVKPGEVKRLAIVQEMEKDIRSETSQRQFGFQFPVVSCGATYAPKRVWGFADVEADGSAHFLAPAGVPIYFLPLNAEGRALQRMRTFTHFMPGERQSCIGCHADRNYVSISPTQIGKSLAAQRPAAPLKEPSWGAKDGFSYMRVVQPVLDRHCIKCHSGEKGAPEPELTGDRTDYFCVSYENLARLGTGAESGGDVGPDMARFGRNPYTSWIPTLNCLEENILWITPKFWGSPASLLSRVVASGHPDGTGKPRVALTPDERLRIHMWIDLNVPFYGTSQSKQPNLRGCRRVYPPSLAAVKKEIEQKKRVALPYQFYVRYDHPERNAWLARGIARGIFTGPEDPDYQRLLAEIIKARPLLDQRNHVDFRAVDWGVKCELKKDDK